MAWMRGLIFFLAGMGFLLVLSAGQEQVIMAEPNSMSELITVEAYIGALNRHDLKAAGELLSDNATMTFVGTDYKMTKPQILASLGWDVGTNGRFSYEILENGVGGVVLALTETNDFLELLSMQPLQAQMQFVVNKKNLIQSISYESKGVASADPGAVQRALEAPVAWALNNEPEELEAIYPNRQLQYTRQSAERWIRLLRAWQDSLGAQP